MIASGGWVEALALVLELIVRTIAKSFQHGGDWASTHPWHAVGLFVIAVGCLAGMIYLYGRRRPPPPPT